MSAIPPDIAGSAAQAGYAARDASHGREVDRTAQANAAARQARAVSDAADSVETTDGDTAVFTDAEGAGSQGRAFEETMSEDSALAATDETEGMDGADAPGLDIKA